MSSRTAFLVSLAAFAAVLAGCHRPYYMARNAPYYGNRAYAGIPGAPYAPYVPYVPAVSGTVSYYNVHSCPEYGTCPYGCHTRRTVYPVQTRGTTRYPGTYYGTSTWTPPRVTVRTAGGTGYATWGNQPVRRPPQHGSPHAAPPSHGRPGPGTQGTRGNPHGSAGSRQPASPHGRPGTGTSGNSHEFGNTAPPPRSFPGAGAPPRNSGPGPRRIDGAHTPTERPQELR
jgi:hypothetical protein